MHWRCIRALDATYEIAAELVPDFGRIGSYEELRSIVETRSAGGGTRAHWVRVAAFYNPAAARQVASELHPDCNWRTTSDSLALLLASMIGAQRCSLLKACPVDHVRSMHQAVEEGIVDPESIRFQAAVPTIELVQI